MRVLWFSVTPSLFNPYSNTHNGGGWIASLEQIVRGMPEIELGVSFYFRTDCGVYENDGVKYYTLPNDSRGTLAKWWKPEKTEERVARYLKIIVDFKPDIIQIFGSENDFGLICDKTDVPVVIHIQGSMPPYHNALFPIGMNSYDFIFGSGLKLNRRIIGLRSDRAFRRKADREVAIFKSCHHFMGRTEWDHNLVRLFNPDASYYHCEEALRDSFISSDKKWCGSANGKVKIISVISNPWYKGADLILKTAQLLSRHTDLDIEWNIFGVSDIGFYERKYGIKAVDVNVNVRGAVDKDTLVNELCSSTCYVHSSYIDNSPNSLCEAQYLGVPAIATNVGGISSLVEDGKTGLLFPANDPYTLAAIIKHTVTDNHAKMQYLSENEKSIAIARHNPQKISDNLLLIYQSIINRHNETHKLVSLKSDVIAV